MGILLAGPSVAQLRAEFEKYSYLRQHLKATYDELLEMYRDPHRDFVAIAKTLGLKSTTSARLYYKRYFEPVFGLSGRERHRFHERSEFERAMREMPEQNPFLRAVMESASDAGLAVIGVPEKGRTANKIVGTFLRIQGLVCKIHPVARIQAPTPDRSYAQVSFWRTTKKFLCGSPDAHIFVVLQPDCEPRIFVLPTFVLNRLPKHVQNVKGWIPLHQPNYRGKVPRIDWPKYENSWHLLEGED